MGNFLDTPITDKETDVGEDLQGAGLSYGVSAMQGWRAQMEDDHLHKLGLPDAPDVSLFGVYDGHGGDFVAHYVARKFPEHLSRAGTLRGSDADFATTATKAFETALMSIDAELLQQPEVESGQDQSGSTSVMTLISPKHIVCANTGDSRAVLCRAGQAVPLSDDHKPYNPEEKARIEAAGGTVKFNRVNGDLAVSRALGDFVYKRCETVERKAQAVTAFPEARPPPHCAAPRGEAARALATDRSSLPCLPSTRGPPPAGAGHGRGARLGQGRVCRARVRRHLGRDDLAAGCRKGAQPSCRRAACGAELERVRGQRSGRAAAARDGHAAGGEEAVGFGGRLRGAHRSLLASGLARQHERAHCPDGPKTQTEARPSVTASDGRWVGMR